MKALSEAIADSPTTQFLIRTAKRKKCILVGGVAERANGKIYNSAVRVDAYGVQSVYRNVHLLMKAWFFPGEQPFFAVMVGGICLGIMICFDWFFPEAVRALALQGTKIICLPANLVMPYWQRGMVPRCLENRVFAVTANRLGADECNGRRLDFTGNSQITSPNGDVLASGGWEESVICVDMDPANAHEKRINPLNDLFADRRPECYRI